MTKIVQVPNDMAGSIIGKGGEQIKLFIKQSGAHIQIDNSAENKSKELRDLTVQGSAEEIKLAEKLITEFIVDKRGTLGSSGVLASALNYKIKIKLEVPDNKVGLIIGKNGKTIHQIQNNFRCKFDIPHTHDPGNPLVRTLVLGAHTEAELEGAKNDVFSIVTYGNTVSASAGTTGTLFAMPVASNLASIETEKYGTDKSDDWSMPFKREYNRKNWQEWREYYLKLGFADIGPDAPTEMRSQRYSD